MDRSVELLGEIDLFAKLNQDERRSLVQQTGRLKLPSGAVLFEEGSEGSALYVVVEGTVVIQREVSEGTMSQVARMGPGQYFGEYSLFDREPRSAAAIAEGATVVLQFEAADLFSFLDLRPRAAAEFYQTLVVELVTRLRESSERLNAALQFGIGGGFGG